MTIPTGPGNIPEIVARLASGRPILPVWDNEIGGHTFQIGTGIAREFVKVTAPHPAIDLRAEAEKLTWAGRYTTVPAVLDVNTEGSLHWLHTAGIRGDSAVAPRWIEDPGRAVRAIGSGLRALHDRLPVDRCPFSWSVADRVARISAPGGLVEHPPIDRLVVCHGDACAPNTLLDDGGTWCGHVDFGDLGVADRWADLAVASWSLQWNYGEGWDATFFEAYGVAHDPERMAYYRRLWDAED
ncbi:aminoglycoside 3'-phosphotransferase [Mycobacteroides saopaulense]|uniref:Aminoglycoside phosphotransferase APH(3') n=1 Tax=Mycobacteroides saopaulense TaxID=1578165 RepID=A0ABX3BZX6_9MYCO|nr:aminoglycoside 3'-phosphotransferase [Mycobacteroides saopaulense]OHT83056.1 aminoglycoside phosphotransferase APH(3') [Mycobacteroides saopaulense]OHU09757.1 aminoglycoside phosphotransferase APH(3') [Mycobacteroides saopaulense]